MLIIWGTKHVRKHLGRLAHFCPLCRAILPCRLTRVDSVGHVYYLPIGRRETLGCELTCEGCRIPGWTGVETGMLATPGKDRPIDDLLAEAPEGLRAALAERVALQRRAEQGGALDAERDQLIDEVLLTPEHVLTVRSNQTHWDRASRRAALALLIVPIGFLWLASWFLPRNLDGSADWSVAGWAAAGLAGALVLWLLISLGTDVRRYTRRELVPRMADALRALRASPEEIQTRLERLRRAGFQVGRWIKPRALIEAIEGAPAEAGV